MRTLILASVAAVLFLAGCTSSVTNTGGEGPSTSTSLLAGPALWTDPQNTPHPKWGWATLSNPPAGEMPYYWQPFPAHELPGHITGFEHVGQVNNFTAGAGIAVFGRLAFVPDDAKTAHVVDLSDPAHPTELGSTDSAGRGAAIIAYPDGRLVAASATSPGFDVIEFTDPHNPVMLAQVKVPMGGHKLGVVPGTPIVYNAGSSGGDSINPLFSPGPCNVDITLCTGYTEIYNLTDPANPVHVQDFPNGLHCHHIFFWNALDGSKQRAICAGLQYTQLWDTTDPEHPSVIVSLPVHAGIKNTPSAMVSIEDFSHSAGINIAGNVLYVGDENGGGGLPPGCGAGTETPLGTAGTPIGATWFYDISDEQNPMPLGYYTAPRDADHNTPRSCTTHHGRVIPDKEGRDLLAMSYYQDGVILIDFTGISAGTLPKAIAEFNDGTDTWETWYANGYLVTGDLARGLDTFKLT